MILLGLAARRAALAYPNFPLVLVLIRDQIYGRKTIAQSNVKRSTRKFLEKHLCGNVSAEGKEATIDWP